MSGSAKSLALLLPLLGMRMDLSLTKSFSLSATRDESFEKRFLIFRSSSGVVLSDPEPLSLEPCSLSVVLGEKGALDAAAGLSLWRMLLDRCRRKATFLVLGTS